MRVLSVDLGTSNTVAVLAAHGRPPRVVEVDGSATMPSAVFAAEDGKLVVGRDAERRARLDPARFEPNPKRRIDEGSLLLGDVVATGAVRGLQANPGQVSVLSSVAKFFVPTLLERMTAQLSVVLGARLYLRSHPRFGIYQKMIRDMLVAIFADGNTVVNLKNVASQLTPLLDRVPTAKRRSLDFRVLMTETSSSRSLGTKCCAAESFVT